MPHSVITHKIWQGDEEKVISLKKDISDHEEGMLEVGHLLTKPDIAVIRDPAEIEVVGHRIVHGGEKLTQTTVITKGVKEEIKKLFPLAPLHNPGHYKGIEVTEKIFTKATQIAVFDTAFHKTLPEKAFRYAIPEKFYADDCVRVYGFHGISHQYVSKKAIEYLKSPSSKIITIHLGNGCSMAAINSGICLDTSMGLTPLDGLVMGTRSGSIDASVLLFLMEQKGYSAKELTEILNKKSGMLGITGYNDMRDIRKILDDGNNAAQLAYEMYAYRIKKFIGAYAAVLNGLDAVVFTAGVGENDVLVREMACREMEFLGITLDRQLNEAKGPGIREINPPNAAVKVLVIPTNEELEIAEQCVELLKSDK